MTKDEFAAQFIAAHRRMRETFYLVGLPVMLLNMGGVGLMVTLVHARNENFLLYGGIAVAVSTLAMVAWFIAFRRSFARHAPACPSCGHRLTLGERKHAITKGTCLKCNAALFA